MGVEVNRVLIESMEQLFSTSDSIVIAAFEFLKLKHAPESTGLKLLQALGAKGSTIKDVTSHRVLCLTVRRSQADRGFKASAHMSRKNDNGNGYSLRKSFTFKDIQEIRVGGRDEISQGLICVELVLDGHADGEVVLLMENPEQAMLMLAVLMQLFRQSEHKQPDLTGMAIEDVDRWFNDSKSEAIAALGAFAADVIVPGDLDASHSASSGVMVSAKEEADLEELMDVVSMGVADVDTLQARLREQCSALEDANVHSLLANAPYVSEVMKRLKRSQNILDDLDESLKIFDLKLTHMRSDISAIESSNNRLEHQARSHTVLLECLQNLISNLAVPPEMQRTLENPAFEDRLRSVVAAGWTLRDKLKKINPYTTNGLPDTLLNMRVVRDARKNLTRLSSRFVQCTHDYIQALIRGCVESLLQDTRAERSWVAVPNHAPMMDKLSRHANLVKVLNALDKQSLAKLQSEYGSSVNALLRKELRMCVTEMKAACKAEMAQTPLDFNMVNDKLSQIKAVRGRGSEYGSDGMSDMTSEYGGRSTSKAGSSASALKKKTGSGGPARVALSEAYQTLLSVWVPFLLEHTEAATNFLMLYKEQGGDDDGEERGEREGEGGEVELGAHGLMVIDTLLEGVDVECKTIVDLTTRGYHVACLPMLTTTTYYISQLVDNPIAHSLVRILLSCHKRLAANFAAYTQFQLRAIDSYDTKAGVKNLHVLSFISQFALMVHHIETQLTSLVIPGLAKRKGKGGSSHQRWFVSVGNSELSEDLETEIKEAANWQVWRTVNDTYQVLAAQMFTTVERLAASDPKHGERLRLENYSYFPESVRQFAAHAEALRSFIQQAEQRQVQAMQAYIQQQLEYGKLWRALELGEHLDQLLTVPHLPNEVPFQPGCSVAEVRALLASSLSGLDKQLDAMHARVRKHLGMSSIAARVWDTVQQQLLRRYDTLNGHLSMCYPTLRMVPSPTELREIIKCLTSS